MLKINGMSNLHTCFQLLCFETMVDSIFLEGWVVVVVVVLLVIMYTLTLKGRCLEHPTLCKSAIFKILDSK